MIYDYEVTTGTGESLSLADYKGKVILVVNTATGCGFTPQYEPIEQLYKDYHDKGLEILDIPCNQFGGQAPGSDEEINAVCSLRFKTLFPRMTKSEVNGPNQLPLYEYLKSEKGFTDFDPEHPITPILVKIFDESGADWRSSSDIKWNFTKFLIDKEGNVVERFEPTASLDKVEKAVVSLL
jgi:glutathione peroxidase